MIVQAFLFVSLTIVMTSGQDVSLNGTRVICPGEVGVFYCTVEDGNGLEWEVDGETRGFDGFNRPCCSYRGPILGIRPISACTPNSCRLDLCTTKAYDGTHFTAYLTRAQLNPRRSNQPNNRGNRSSLLVYTPEPGTIASVNITCKEGSMTQKSMVLIVCTENDTSPPTNIQHTTEMGGIMLTWIQEDDNVVDHYNIQLEGSEQPILVQERKYIFPIGMSNYNGNLSAVNVCGEESEAVSFSYNIDICPTVSTFLTPASPSELIPEPTSAPLSNASSECKCGSSSVLLSATYLTILIPLTLFAAILC